MPYAFDDCLGIEGKSLEILRPFIRRISLNGQYTVIEKGRLALELQSAYGDIFINHKNDGGLRTIEIKSEVEDKYGNLFIELWSNRKFYNPGWIYKLNVDLLFYHFINNDKFYTMSYPELREWIFCCESGEYPRLYQYAPKVQSKYEQLNDTWGACVKIDHLRNGLRSFKEFCASTGVLMSTPIIPINKSIPTLPFMEAR